MSINEKIKPLFIKSLGTRLYSGKKRQFALYNCPFCGNEFESHCEIINQGDKKSCGCVTAKLRTEQHIKHGLSKHKLFKVWTAIKERCRNPKDKGFKNYGGRGIFVSEKWIDDFQSFYDWSISNGYKEGLTIDRINNDGNYEPKNCRWTTYEVQSTNKRLGKTSSTGIYGVLPFGEKYISRISIKNTGVHLGVFKTIDEALNIRNEYIKDNKLTHKIQRIKQCTQKQS